MDISDEFHTCLGLLQMDISDEFRGDDDDEPRVGEGPSHIRNIETFINMEDDIDINKVYTKKSSPQESRDLKVYIDVIPIGSIGIVGKKHLIMSTIEAMAKETLDKDKEIKRLKKENAAQNKLSKGIDQTKMPHEDLKKFGPLTEGLTQVKKNLSDEVVDIVRRLAASIK